MLFLAGSFFTSCGLPCGGKFLSPNAWSLRKNCILPLRNSILRVTLSPFLISKLSAQASLLTCSAGLSAGAVTAHGATPRPFSCWLSAWRGPFSTVSSPGPTRHGCIRIRFTAHELASVRIRRTGFPARPADSGRPRKAVPREPQDHCPSASPLLPVRIILISHPGLTSDCANVAAFTHSSRKNSALPIASISSATS